MRVLAAEKKGWFIDYPGIEIWRAHRDPARPLH